MWVVLAPGAEAAAAAAAAGVIAEHQHDEQDVQSLLRSFDALAMICPPIFDFSCSGPAVSGMQRCDSNQQPTGSGSVDPGCYLVLLLCAVLDV